MTEKRAFDILFSLSVLIIGAPIFLLLILLVKFTSLGPVFYKGLRMGQHGRLFSCYKFRTMCQDAEKKLQAILDSDPKKRQEWGTFHKLKNDPRLTKIGYFLRISSLDELPQFWNVLIGDLSTVGPRPIEIKFPKDADREIRLLYGEKTDKILSLKPGITCLWQVRGRNQLTFEERAVMEEEYVDTHNFWIDLKIIFKTIGVLLLPKGAY